MALASNRDRPESGASGCLYVFPGLIPPLLRLRHRADAGYLRRFSLGRTRSEAKRYRDFHKPRGVAGLTGSPA